MCHNTAVGSLISGTRIPQGRIAGGPAHDAWVLPRHIVPLNVLPPWIRVLDLQAHHEIAGVLGNVERWQQATERTDL